MARTATNRPRWPYKVEDLHNLGYQRAKLDALVSAALKRAKRPEAEWPAALDRIAAAVEELVKAPPFLPEKPPPRALLTKVERSARCLFEVLSKQRADPAFGVRWTLDERLRLALFKLNEALADREDGRGRPRVRLVGAVAETLADEWRREQLSFVIGAKFEEREWPQFVEYVFRCAGLPWARKHARDVASRERSATRAKVGRLAKRAKRVQRRQRK